mgnify:CR=1 FL=1
MTGEVEAASMLVGDFVWGGRAADLYLTDWSELVFELEKEAHGAAEVVYGPTSLRVTHGHHVRFRHWPS